jgi:hypothetical protein
MILTPLHRPFQFRLRTMFLVTTVAAVACGPMVWFYDRSVVECWVGSADLEIEFAVADSTTGHPIKHATVAIRSEGGFHREAANERTLKTFDLVTDGEGIARTVCHETMSFGTQSNLRFTDTYHVHLPWWQFGVSAAHYESSGAIDLETHEYDQQVKHVGFQKAKLTIRVTLRPMRVEGALPAAERQRTSSESSAGAEANR